MIRTYGHSPTTPEEKEANARGGIKTEEKGDTFIYIYQARVRSAVLRQQKKAGKTFE